MRTMASSFDPTGLNRSKSPYRPADSRRQSSSSCMFKSFKHATNAIPSEMHPPWSTVFKYPIGDMLKTDHHGVRPTQLTKISVLRQIEEIYTKFSKMKQKKFFDTIYTDRTFSAYVYKYFCPSKVETFTETQNQANKASQNNSAQLKQHEKNLVNFIHSVDQMRDESKSCDIFSGILSGLVPPEAIAFLIDLRRIIEEELGNTICQLLSKKNCFSELFVPYRNLRKILDQVFGNEQSVVEFLDKIKEIFPEIALQYNVPYERFVNFCVTEFIAAKGSRDQRYHALVEKTHSLHPFKEKFEEYKYKTKISPDIKIYDRLLKNCRRKMKNIVPLFIDLITQECKVREREEFAEFKNLIKELLLNKCMGLMESVIANNREMWFSLLTIETPDQTDTEYLSEVVQAWSELVRDEDKHQKIKKSGEQEQKDVAFEKTEKEILNLQDYKIEKFCKMMITNAKMTQEICRLIIYLTNKDI